MLTKWVQSGGGPRVPPEATLGSSYAPALAGSTVNKTTTWFPMQSLPVASILNWWECYATATGTVKLKLATEMAVGSGWQITDLETLVVDSTGLKRFSVEDGTLTQQTIPANSLIGFITPSSGGATISFGSSGAYADRGGYLAGAGDLSGASQVLTAAASYTNEIQVRAGVSYDAGASPGSYLIDEPFAGSVAPAWSVNNATTPWSFAVAGVATCAGTGLANFLDFYPTSNGDAMVWDVTFEFQSAGDRFASYRKPIIGGGGADDGTIIEADLDANTIKIYEPWTGGTNYTLPTVESSLVLTSMTLATGVEYRLELIYLNKVVTAKIVRTSDNVQESLQVDNGAALLSGLCHGRPGFANIAGSALVKSCRFYAQNNTNPQGLICGDSISGDFVGVPIAQQYVDLVIDRISGGGWYSSDGGTTSLNGLRRLRHELRLCRPKYALILFGANDAASDAGRDAYVGYMQEIYDLCVSQGVVPVVLVPTPASDATRNARLDVMRAALLAKGWKFVRTDIALSLNGDGSTYDATFSFDGLHPNSTGYTAISARVTLDWPWIFI